VTASVLPALLLAGCAERIAVPRDTPPAMSSKAWESLIADAVDEDGLVDYALIERQRDVLDSWLAWASTNGPLADEWQEVSENKRLAFMINAQNAAVVLAVITKQPKESVQEIQVGIWRRPGAAFAHGLEFRIDSAWRTLDKLRNELTIIRYQEPRGHFAMTLAARGGPVLRFLPDSGVDKALGDATRAFVQSDRALRPTADGWAASELFFRAEKDLLEWGNAGTLCEWLVGYTDEGEAHQWMVEHARDCPLQSFPMDWSLDRQ
jgi:hypothetical protein